MNYLVGGYVCGGMERDLELRVKGHLYEIGEVNDEIIGDRRGFIDARHGYRQILELVGERVGTAGMVDKYAKMIKEEMQRDGERPPTRRIRRRANRDVEQME